MYRLNNNTKTIWGNKHTCLSAIEKQVYVGINMKMFDSEKKIWRKIGFNMKIS